MITEMTSRHSGLPLHGNRGRSILGVQKDSSRLRAAVSRVTGSLRRNERTCRQPRCHLVVVLIPDEAQIDPALSKDVARASGRSAQDLDFAQPNQWLAAALKAEGVRVIDLLPAFRDRGASGRLYKPRDTHWNIAGNALAAEAIAASLKLTMGK
jgi:hypothetical protein